MPINDWAYYILWVTLIWLLLNILAVVLIQQRKDKKQVMDDLSGWLKHHGIFGLISVFFLFIVLPFSIPYSIAHLTRKK